MTTGRRKFMLTAHVVLSAGWLGSVAAYLALGIVGLLNNHGADMTRAAYLSMEVLGWYVIVPFSLATLIAGLVESLGTPWGLFRRWWVLAKFGLTVGATIVLLLHMQAVTHMAGLASDTILSATDFRAQRIQLVVHAGGGLFVLLAATALSTYKPWGLTPYGKRRKHKQRTSVTAERLSHVESHVEPSLRTPSGTPRWAYVVGYHAIGLVVLFIVLHLVGGGMRH